MKKPTMLRKRYIPDETVDISNDQILFRDLQVIVTKWDSIKPRTDFTNGISFTFLNEGIKLSKMYDSQGNFLFWYCDIINVQYDDKEDTYLFTDLLLDVKVMKSGETYILDCDELAEALDNNIISKKQASEALRKTNHLLNMIYTGKFPPQICNKESFG